MPDRIIRDELLDSERWLSLSDDTCRLAYVVVLLRCDALGNYPADVFRLRRLWRDLQIPTDEIAAKRLAELLDHDLIKLYDVDGKRYLHVPRFRQRLRYLKRLFPMSPWTTDHEKQMLAEHSPGERQVRDGSTPGANQVLTPEVKGSEEKRSEEKGGVAGFSSSTEVARANPDPEPPPPPKPETHVLKIGNITQNLNQTYPRKTVDQIEADRARQLDYVAKMTREPKS